MNREVRPIIPSAAIAFALCGLVACSGNAAVPAQEQAAETIFTGDFVTLDRASPRVEALAVKGGRIVAAGPRADVLRLAAASTRAISG